MSNMSYCRFRNTLEDLRDCESALDDMYNGSETVIAEEKQAADRLIRVCQRIADSYGDQTE